jgi:hypothetical protein
MRLCRAVDSPLTFADDVLMWFVILLTLCSAALPHFDFINVYRLSFGFVQVGVFEFGLAIGLVYALIKGGDYAQRFPSLRVHPVLVWLLVLFTVGSIAGMIGSINSMLPMKYKIAATREFVAAPICIIMGYRLLATPRSLMPYVRISILCGVITSLLIFWYFNSAADRVQATGQVNYLRDSIKQVSGEFASVTGLLLLWALSANRRIMRPTLTFLVMMFCFIGYLATLGRTNLVVMVGGAATLILIIPKGRRIASVLRLIVLGPVIFFLLYGSIWVGGKVVGRDNFVDKITSHFATLLPSERHIGEDKAWDSRLGSIMQEIRLWAENPLFGNGFMSQEAAVRSGEMDNTGAYNHNGWTATLAKTGLFGFSAVALMFLSTTIIGYRMVRRNVAPEFVMFGALAFCTGVDFLLRVSCTMAIQSRFAIQYGMVCGLVIRAREMEETARAMQSAESYAPYVDPESGLMVPDYQSPAALGAIGGGFGSVN